jgi:uncharacterized protein YraI
MRLLKLGSAVLAIAMMGTVAAEARTGFSTANVNMRTGPDTEFPSVGVIPEGSTVNIQGCLRDESWCDVLWGPNRGWVFSEYLAFSYRGEMRPLPDVGLVALSLPIIAFSARGYWDRYYRGRPWYAERGRWYAYTPRARPGWHPPPRGPRTPGWWRSGYSAPPGMMAPVPRWRRPGF